MPKDTRSDLLRDHLRRFPLFDPDRYLARHPDLRAASVDPLEHFTTLGIWEGRDLATTVEIASLLASIGRGPQAPPETLSPTEEARVLRSIAGLQVGIYANSRGNFFMREMAELVVAGLRSLGADARLLDENAAIEGRPGIRLFVAPHEFFALGRGPAWAQDEIVSSSFLLSTEQVQTPWFREALPYLLMAKGVVDLNYQNFRLTEQTGKPALFHYPGFEPSLSSEQPALPDHPLARTLPPAVTDYDASSDLWSERPLDVVFLGSESPVRDRFFDEWGTFFGDLSSFILYVRLQTKPILANGVETRPALNRYVCRRAKIVLNIHQSEVAYFEWHRMVMQGMWQNALVISDPCLSHPVFKPGIHYLEESPARIPLLIEWLLTTREGRMTAERVRHAAFAALVEHGSRRRMSLLLGRFLADTGAPSALAYTVGSGS